MNDLAERALHHLGAARRQVVARPLPVLAVAGFVLGAVIVWTGGRIGASPAVVPIDRWFGLLPPASYEVTGVGMGVAMLAAIAALLGLWVLVCRLAATRVWTARELTVLAVGWATPFAVGPPLLDTDLYLHVARGLLARDGLSPYHHGVSVLDNRIVEAVDPTWRGAPSTSGPLATLVEHLAVSLSAGSVVAAIVLLRLLAIAAVVGLARAAAASGPRAPDAVALTALNPAVLIFAISSGPLLAVLCALLVALLAAARGRRWVRAVLLACLAAGVKPIALLAVPAVVLAHVFARPRRLRHKIVARDSAVAVAVLAAVSLAVPYSLGWIGNLSEAIHEHIPLAPSALVSDVIGVVVPSASFDDLAAGGRIATATGGVIVVGYLFATMRTRPLDRTLGYALLAAGLLAPVVYPPFLLWGVVCLAPTARDAGRDWVLALSCVACVLAPVGLGDAGADRATLICLAVVAAVLLPRLHARRRRIQRLAPPAISRTAGRTSAR